MGKYDALYSYLNGNGGYKVVLSFQEIEQILQVSLPYSAYTYKQWWDNNSHTQSKSWCGAGYKVAEISLGNRVIFIKK